MSVEIRLLGPDAAEGVADDVFDAPVDVHWAATFLADPRHHLAVALDGDLVVGMVSALDYVHPDKAPQLWINEVGVASSHRRRGIARRLLDAMLAHARTLGCTEAWLGTEPDNIPARRLYEGAGGTAAPFILYEFPLAADPVLPPD